MIVGHSFPLVAGHTNNLEKLSALAVNLFFCISGFLIYASAQRGNVISYLWKRFLRIFPGLWVALLFVAFVAAPLGFLAGHGEGSWQIKDALQHWLRNADLIRMQWNLGDSPTNIPYEYAWNGSIWTLHFEILAYLLVIPLAFYRS